VAFQTSIFNGTKTMPINIAKLRRLKEAAEQDRTPERFTDELATAFEKKEIKPSDFSIREVFEQFLPDGRELVNSWNPRSGGSGVSLATILENDAVKTAAFSNISGQIVYNAILESFMMEEFVFSRMIPTVSTQFSGEKIAGIGGMGDKAEVVDEGHAYPMAGLNEDWIRTPETKKRGLIIPLTKEAAFFDRTGELIGRCSEVGEYLGLNKEKRAIDCVIDENTTTHRYNRKDAGAIATYGNNSGTHDWDNLEATNALVDWTDVDNAEQLLNAILDPNTGEPIVIGGRRMLIVTKSLETTAGRIRNATEVVTHVGGYATSGNLTEMKTGNPVGGKFEVVTSRLLAPRLATDTSWFYGDPTKAFAYMQNWPLSVVQAPANSELEFTNDIAMRWKSSERGTFATKEPRYMVTCTA
jgi:hypothetical protein